MINPLNRTRPISLGNDVSIGGQDIVLIFGPCAVEKRKTMWAIAKAIASVGGKIIRGGAFKPRTSPYDFQGLGLDGLKIIREVADEFGLLVITEALAVEHVELIYDYADIVQVGSRNMQHFPLLWEVGKIEKPVLLKRGFMSTIDEWLAASEHIRSKGNERIILCERGIRGFDSSTRNTLDIIGMVVAKRKTEFPIIADPSHATGRRDLIFASSRACIAAGADGLLVEVHTHPSRAMVDSQQALPTKLIEDFVEEITRVASSVDRGLDLG